jgi:hypothetical protein
VIGEGDPETFCRTGKGTGGAVAEIRGEPEVGAFGKLHLDPVRWWRLSAVVPRRVTGSKPILFHGGWRRTACYAEVVRAQAL